MATLRDAVVVVTGAGRGIGRAIAEELGQEGAIVAVNYAHSAAAAEEVVAFLHEHGSPKSFSVQADVSRPEGAATLIERVAQECGRIDVLVNNAGITIDKTMKNLTTEDWDAVVQTNLNGYFYTVKAALPYFMAQEHGTIINISSFVGKMGNFGQANYAAAKAGILGFTKTAALELARYKVTVNAICPGFIETEMYTKVPDNVKQNIIKRIPLGRVGTPHEVARAVRYIIMDGDYMTGQALDINGGIYM